MRSVQYQGLWSRCGSKPPVKILLLSVPRQLMRNVSYLTKITIYWTLNPTPKVVMVREKLLLHRPQCLSLRFEPKSNSFTVPTVVGRWRVLEGARVFWQYPKIGDFKKWKFSFFLQKIIACQQVLAKSYSVGDYKNVKTCWQCMSLMEKTEFHFFHVPIFGYCRMF